MKNTLLKTLVPSILLLGTVNNISYAMEDNPVNEQVNNDITNNNDLSDINNLSAEIDGLDDNSKLVKYYYSMAKEYFSKLNEIEYDVIKKFQNIEDCLKICDECYVNIAEPETLKNDIINVFNTKYYNSKMYNNVLYITGHLKSLIDRLTYDINMCCEILKDGIALLKERNSICSQLIDSDIKKLDSIVSLHKCFSETYNRTESLIKLISEERNKLKELEQSKFEVKEQKKEKNTNQQQTTNCLEHSGDDIVNKLEFDMQRSIAIKESKNKLKEYNNMLSNDIEDMEELLNKINKCEKSILQIDMKKYVATSKDALLFFFYKTYTNYSMMLKLYNTINAEWKKNDYSNLIIKYRDRISELNEAVEKWLVKISEIALKETHEPRYKWI